MTILIVYLVLVFVLLGIGGFYLIISAWLQDRKMRGYAKKYGKLKSQMEKARFLLETFGKDGMDYTGLMEKLWSPKS